MDTDEGDRMSGREFETHRIDLEAAVAEFLESLDPLLGPWPPEDHADDLLAIIYGWHQEQVTDARRATTHHPARTHPTEEQV